MKKAVTTHLAGDEQAARLVALYTQAEREITARIQKAYNRATVNKATIVWLEKQRKEVRAIIKRLNAKVGKQVTPYVEAAYGGGIKVAEMELTAAGISITAEMGGINNRVMKVYSTQISARLADVATVAGRTVEDIYSVLKINTALVGALAGHESINALSRRLEKAAEGKGLVSFIDKAGKQWNMASYVDMLTRTTTMQLHNEAVKNEFLEHGEDLVRVSHHTPTCPKCEPFGGKVLSLTGETKGYTTLDEAKAAGLFHPNCRHTITLYIGE